jgi:hypothetical protein
MFIRNYYDYHSIATEVELRVPHPLERYMSNLNDLEKLAELRDKGILSAAEFDAKKSELLKGPSIVIAPSTLPKKKMALWKKILAGLFVLGAIGRLVKTNDNPVEHASVAPSTLVAPSAPSATVSPPQAKATPISTAQRMQGLMPPGQDALLVILQAARQQYAAGQNDMAKGAARPARARSICGSLTSQAVSSWVGKVNSLSTNSEGKGVLKLEIGPDAYVKTYNNSLSDIGSKSLIEPNSQMYADAVKLSEGQIVAFSGNFLRSDTDCIEESSISIRGSIDKPEFIMVFKSISPVN